MKKKNHKHTQSNLDKKDRRLSLKSIKSTATTKIKSQINRLSINNIPRQSLQSYKQINNSVKSPQSFIQYTQKSNQFYTDRNSFKNIYLNRFNNNKHSNFIKKQTIINNLVKKLDQQDQDDLKTIISSKLNIQSKNKISQNLYFLTTEQYPIPTNYHTPVNQDNQVLLLRAKLEKYQKQIDTYKKIINDLNKKLSIINHKNNYNQLNYESSKQNIKRNAYLKKKNSIAVQVQQKDKINLSLNFYQNIDNTLKVLNRF